jgi:hypothetical protein
MKHYGLEEVYDGMLNEFRFYGTSKQNFGDYRELFFNPSNNDSTILDIIKAFRDSGGEVGEGIS